LSSVYIVYSKKTERIIRCKLNSKKKNRCKTYQVIFFNQIGVNKGQCNNLNSIIFVMKLNLLSQFKSTVMRAKTNQKMHMGLKLY